MQTYTSAPFWHSKTFKYVLCGASFLGLSYLTYRFWANLTQKSTKKQIISSSLRKISQQSVQPQNLHTLHSNYSQFYFDKEEQLKVLISKISEKGPTIQDLYLLSPNILVDEYQRYTKEIRKRRRLIRKSNQDMYIGLIRNYQMDVKELLQRGREEVLEEFGQPPEDLERMQSAFQVFDDLQELRKMSLQNLKAKAFPQARLRRIPKQKLRSILQQQINFINSKMYSRLKTKLQDDQLGIPQGEIYRIILTLIDDIVYEKYGYEREEIEKQINQLPMLAKDLKKCRNSLFAEIGQIDIDSQEEGEEGEEEDDGNKLSLSAQTQILDDSLETP